jgi:hypothetical protein
MLMLELALAALLTTKETAPKPPAPANPPAAALFGPELVKTIKSDIESISGPGSVDISIDHETLYSVRVAVPSLSPEICTPIYDRELKLYRYFPDLNFDFYLRLKDKSASGQSR